MKRQMLKLMKLLMIITLVTTAFMPYVNAAPDLTKTEGSLKITKYEVGDKGQLVLEGVTFDIYKVDDDETSTALPTNSAILATKQSKTTNASGIAQFTNLPLGRYLVVESNAPANVVSRIANFLVDIPMTSADGESLIYDVEVSPKNNTVYGAVELTKVDAANNQGLADVEFDLEKLDGTNWVKYGETLATADGTTDVNAAGDVLEKGKIEITGLPAGTYRFVEKATLEGYILDNKTTYEFTVALGDNGQTTVTGGVINVKNDKPVVTKEVVSELTEGSAEIGDVIDYEITTNIPTKIEELPTYQITEKIDEGLTYDPDSLVVKTEEDTLVKDTDYTVTTDANGDIVIELTDSGKTKVADDDTLTIEYSAELNENADATTVGNTTTTELIYSTVVEEDYKGVPNTNVTEEITDSSTVYTGGFYIKKVDNQDVIIPTGATFRIATSEANAKNGTFIDGIELTTGTNGLVSYKGLAYGTYWLVETKAPTYEETNSEGVTETKSYNLLRKPVQITVNGNTFTEASAVSIINKKGFELPVTGATGSLIVTALGIAVIVLGTKMVKTKEEK